jgi:putative transposase
MKKTKGILLKVILQIFGKTRQALHKSNQKKLKLEDIEGLILDILKPHLAEFKNMGIDKLYRTILTQMKDLGIKYGRNKFRELMSRVHLRPRRNRPIGKKYVIGINDSDPCKNLIEDLEIVSKNQVWQIDITTLKFNGLKLYLTCIIDSYSRKVLSFSLSDAQHSQETSIRCLKSALSYGKPSIIHSDRGPQFNNLEWCKILRCIEIKASYSRPGRPYENGKIERIFGTLKNELELRKLQSDSYSGYLKGIQEIIYKYNFKRLHQALNYATPQSVYINSK